MTWCSHLKTFLPLHSTESRRHKLYQEHIIKMTHSQECYLLRVDPVHTFCHHTMLTKITINDTTFSSEIIKKGT